MVELEFKLELSDYLQLLSKLLKRKWNIFLRFAAKLSIQLFALLKNQYHFLRQFKYTKENVTAHLMKKASQFFGIELDENRGKRRRRNKPFKSGFRLKKKQASYKNKLELAHVNSKLNKKQKKNRINIYRSPE